MRAQCTTGVPNLGRVLEIHPEPIYTARTRMQAEQDTPEWREAYRARAGIEGTVSQLRLNQRGDYGGWSIRPVSAMKPSMRAGRYCI
ncbi:transposase, partial [Kitasatospora aureofaciens]|uniref:transposase n=1 Tax=Kitasatospora aureofaciens TaxID=1894 RepID=UPI0033C47923